MNTLRDTCMQVCHARAHNHEQQMELIISVAAMMADEPFKLLIVDSITANLRVDFCGRGELAERQQKLGQMLSRLKKVKSPVPCWLSMLMLLTMQNKLEQSSACAMPCAFLHSAVGEDPIGLSCFCCVVYAAYADCHICCWQSTQTSLRCKVVKVLMLKSRRLVCTIVSLMLIGAADLGGVQCCCAGH